VERTIRSLKLAVPLLAVLVALSLLWAVTAAQVGAANGASNPKVSVFGTKQVKQTATTSGKHNPLLTLGPLGIRAQCIAEGGSTIRLNIQGKSTKASGKVLFPDGTDSLSSAWQTLYFVTSAAPDGLSSGFDVLYRDGTYYHFQVDLYVNGLGADCVSRLVATSA
jgi:hypothetical protein